MGMVKVFWIECDSVDDEPCEYKYPEGIGSKSQVDAARRAREDGFKSVMGPSGRYIWLCPGCVDKRGRAKKR